MSRFALLLITDAQSVDDACRGWLPPLETPIKQLIKNPFNGKTMSVDSYVPPEFDGKMAASQYVVYKKLSKVTPISIDFQCGGEADALIDAAVPYRIRRGPMGLSITIDRVPYEKEQRVVEVFEDQLGEYDDPGRRRAEKLRMYFFVYDC
ncbi:hypothetical protein [Lacipirellula limnantheis]|uniref:Uncharacterized protein n=1 Tax=Lacipirellula limnantheis TaxID=2528024 RepID=A0A517TSA8_9BACT|nr:hypothetical protein [Lacipirellula limnantheis]QDT71262.1 hypothetical protein I41_04180 [Lacipirellula limnantheis]